MKVAILIYSLSGGGAERFISYFIPYLKEKGVDVYLVLMRNLIQYELDSQTKIYLLENSNPTESGIIKFLKLPFLAFKYHQFLKKNKIDKSFSLLTRPNLISLMTKFFNSKRKIIISERDNPTKLYEDNSLQSNVNKFLIKNLFPKADFIIPNSEGNRIDLIKNFNVSEIKTKTINNPIDLDKIEKMQSLNDFFDKSYFNLIILARLDKAKNHKLLIETLGKLKDHKIRLYIFGEGNLKTELEKQVNLLSLERNVFFMGFNSNPYQYLKSADLFVFSSNNEGFPNVLLEAMACDLPIISTNCPSGPNEILQSDIDYSYSENKLTEYGILVPMENSELFKKAILYMMENKEYYLNCKSNLKNRVQNFKKNVILEKYYQQLNLI